MAVGPVFDPGQIRHTECPLCCCTIRKLFVARNEFGVFSIERCTDCGFAFVNPTPSEEYIASHYSMSGFGGRRRKTIDDVLQEESFYPNATVDAKRMINNIVAMAKNKRMLDVGCGYGWFSLQAIRAGLEVTSLEIGKEERTIAAQILGFEPFETSFEDMEEPDEGFGAVLMSQVLEHAREPDKWISKARDILEKDGVIAVALPNFASIFSRMLRDKDPYVTPPTHLNYFSPYCLSRLLEKNGFIIVRMETLSRIPARAVEDRLGRFLGRYTHRIFASSSTVLDWMHMGAMLNVYAMKA